MKTLTATAALMLALGAPLSAQSLTEKATGCATKPIDGSNALQFVDPTCAASAPGGSGPRPARNPAAVDALRDALPFTK